MRSDLDAATRESPSDRLIQQFRFAANFIARGLQCIFDVDLEGEHLRGVLIADRVDNRPFDESDIAVMNTIAVETVRAVQVERIFSEMDREKYQKERFYQASRDFNSARTIGQEHWLHCCYCSLWQG